MKPRKITMLKTQIYLLFYKKIKMYKDLQISNISKGTVYVHFRKLKITKENSALDHHILALSPTLALLETNSTVIYIPPYTPRFFNTLHKPLDIIIHYCTYHYKLLHFIAYTLLNLCTILSITTTVPASI